MERTITELVEATGISRFTFAQVAREGRFKGAARQSGKTWMIDDDHPDYKDWLTAHQHQPRVIGEKRFPMPIEEYEFRAIEEPKTALECTRIIDAGHVTLVDALLQPLGSIWEEAAGRCIARIAAQFEHDEEIDLEKILTPETWNAFQIRKNRQIAAFKEQRGKNDASHV